MASFIPSAKITLSYPLYGCDFDPLDPNRLVVGGGGGAGRSGVGNRITILDASKPEELVEAGEIELSRDEDNPTSLAVGQNKLVYAGVNSSPKDIQDGHNLHLRVYGIEPAKENEKEKEKGKVMAQSATLSLSEVSRCALFCRTDKDTYQRITRLSKPYAGQSQLGAVATGLAKQSEIVLFDTTTNPPNSRGAVQTSKEAVDIDVVQIGPQEYLFAYCDDHDVYIKNICALTENKAPECIYVTPATCASEKPAKPTFRALRWLTRDYILMLTNIHGNNGVILQILRIPSNSKGQSRIAQSHRLPSRITKATGLAVANLTPPLAPNDPQQYTQFVIAVAGHDRSLSLLKTDLQTPEAKTVLISSIIPFRTIKDVHPLQITSLSFSNFTPPAHPVSANTPPQVLKLASVSVSNTIVVYTLPLFPIRLSLQRGQSKLARYVVAVPSSATMRSLGIVATIISAAIVAIFIQSILEIRGGVTNYLGARERMPVLWQQIVGGEGALLTSRVASETETSAAPMTWGEAANPSGSL